MEGEREGGNLRHLFSEQEAQLCGSEQTSCLRFTGSSAPSGRSHCFLHSCPPRVWVTWLLLSPLTPPHFRTQGRTPLTSKDVGNRSRLVCLTAALLHRAVPVSFPERVPCQTPSLSCLPAHLSPTCSLPWSRAPWDAQSGPQGLVSQGEGPTCTGTTFLPALSSPPRSKVRPRGGKHESPGKFLKPQPGSGYAAILTACVLGRAPGSPQHFRDPHRQGSDGRLVQGSDWMELGGAQQGGRGQEPVALLEAQEPGYHGSSVGPLPNPDPVPASGTLAWPRGRAARGGRPSALAVLPSQPGFRRPKVSREQKKLRLRSPWCSTTGPAVGNSLAGAGEGRQGLQFQPPFPMDHTSNYPTTLDPSTRKDPAIALAETQSPSLPTPQHGQDLGTRVVTRLIII